MLLLISLRLLHRRFSPDTVSALLDVAAALGSGWRPTPSAALTLAELHLDRAASLGPAAVAATLAPPPMEAEVESTSALIRAPFL